MADQPEALRLADALEFPFAAPSVKEQHAAAAELRRLAGVEAERDALLEALKEYGWHYEGCPQYPTYTHPDRWPACTCGFDDAIKAARKGGGNG